MHVLLLRDSKRTIMSNYVDTMDQDIANVRQLYASHPPAPEMPGDLISPDLLPVYDGLWFCERAGFTENALLSVTLALRAFRLEHGAYPKALQELTPFYLHSVPDDPFALSGPLHYRRTGTRYVLYSIGPDGKDDGGKPIFDAKKSPPVARLPFDPRYTVEQKRQSDIVAGLNTYFH